MSTPDQSPSPEEQTNPEDFLMGLRYSLPAMLREIQTERISGSFSQEKLDQKEIGKLFKPKKRTRAKQSE